jgi:hypothetical protein
MFDQDGSPYNSTIIVVVNIALEYGDASNQMPNSCIQKVVIKKLSECLNIPSMLK